MPHQCVRCSKFYDDGSVEIIDGCECGAKLFFYIRKEKLEELKAMQQQLVSLPPKEKEQIEKDVLSIIGADTEEDQPVVLDIESIRVVKPGKFEIDLVHLFNKENPLIFKLGEGKYMIDLPETFRRREEFKKEKEEADKRRKEAGREADRGAKAREQRKEKTSASKR